MQEYALPHNAVGQQHLPGCRRGTKGRLIADLNSAVATSESTVWDCDGHLAPSVSCGTSMAIPPLFWNKAPTGSNVQAS